jgi:hypothetical protein
MRLPIADLPRYLASLRIDPNEFVVPQSSNLFIGGTTGRTGTSWLMRVLRTLLGSGTTVIGEHGAFVLSGLRQAGYEYYQTVGGESSRRRYLRHFRSFVNGPAFKRRRVYGHGLRGLSRIVPRRAIAIAFDALSAELAGARTLPECNVCFGRFYSRLLNFHALLENGTLRWISKEPPYGRHVDDLCAMIPDARVVLTCRDGRDTALSMHRKGWHPTLVQCIDRWRAFTDQTLDAIERVPPESVLLVRYEDLTLDLEAHLRRILGFFGIGAPTDLGSALEGENFAHAPLANNSGKWAAAYRPEELEHFERTCAATMDRLGCCRV